MVIKRLLFVFYRKEKFLFKVFGKSVWSRWYFGKVIYWKMGVIWLGGGGSVGKGIMGLKFFLKMVNIYSLV